MLPCSGETCLHQAATAGQLDSVKMLLAAGANPDLQCAKSGKTGEDNELDSMTTWGAADDPSGQQPFSIVS